MKITEIRETTISLRSPIRNAWIDFSEMTTSLVVVKSDVVRDGKPLCGFGFNSNGRYAVGSIIRDRLAPRLTSANPDDLLDDARSTFDPVKCHEVMMRNEKPGGHGDRSVACGAIDMAAFDLTAKVLDVPLWKYLSDRFSTSSANRKVFVYAAGGYYVPGKSLQDLQDEMRSYRALGYQHVKMKIGGADLAEDLRRIEAVLEVTGDGKYLLVDANGRLNTDAAIAYAKALQPYNLFWYEEPCDPLDYFAHSEVTKHYKNPMATGENLFSAQEGINLLRYAGMRPDRDFVQIDPALAGGLSEYLKFLQQMPDFGWSAERCIPHGGHQFTLHIAAALGLYGNESYPGIFEPIGGFADGVEVIDGYVELSDAVGIGIENKKVLMDEYRKLLD